MQIDIATAQQSADTLQHNRETLAALYSGRYDFLDFGCSRGGSMELAQALFGEGRGLGLDIDPAKVALAQESGRDAMVADLTRLPLQPNPVRYVILSHFLEHLPGLKAAEQALACAIRAAKDFVFVAQPWFDSDGYLFKRGLKLYWSDWHGHPNRMTSLDFHYLLEAFRKNNLIQGYSIFGYGPIYSSRNGAVHPLASPRNQNKYDAAIHHPKPKIPKVFTNEVFTEIQILIDIHSNNSLSGYRNRYPNAKRLFSSYD